MRDTPCPMPFYYEQIDLGYNYRMTELQAALGYSQLQRLDEFVAKRHELARRYDYMLADLPITTPWQHPEAYSALHLYPIRLQLDKLSVSRGEVFDKLREQGIGVNVHYIPVHTQPYYRRKAPSAMRQDRGHFLRLKNITRRQSPCPFLRL